MYTPLLQVDPPWAGRQAPGSSPAAAQAELIIDADRLVSDLGREIAGPLTAALERLDRLRDTGQIDGAGLADLRAQVEYARQAAMIGQRLGRLARGRIRQAAGRLDLTRLLRAAVDECAQSAAARGLEVREILRPAEVVIDSALAFSLVKALVDWSVDHAHSRVDLAIDFKTWPTRARLSCRFAYLPEDLIDEAGAAEMQHLETITWHLVQQTAVALGLPIQRELTGGFARVVIEFPRTVSEPIKGVSVVEIDDSDAGFALDAGTLAGSHVLVVAARREIRALVRDAIRSMGLLVDFVGSVCEARRFCASGLPHAIVYESALAGDRFDEWQRELQARLPAPGFIEIGEQGREYEAIVRGGRQTTRIGRDGLANALPAALGFELGKALAN